MRDNPAQRLHDLLAAMGAQSAQLGTSLAHVVGTSLEDLPAVLDAAAEAARLPRLIVRDLGRLPDEDVDAELHMEWADRVQNALQCLLVLANPLESFTRQYNEATLVSLRHTSHALRRLGRDVPDEEVDELRAAVAAIRRAAVADDPDIDPRLRHFLLARAAEMDRAIMLFRITGSEGIQAAVERAFGAEVIQSAAGKPTPDSTTPSWSQLLRDAQKASTCTPFVNNMADIATKIAGVLG